jgi:ABC-type multidrug transport system fused ATPase/permease subunit
VHEELPRLTDAAAALEWRRHESERVVVHALADSYAAGRAATELRDAERLAAAVDRILRPPGPTGGRVDVYLLDPVPDRSDDRPAAGAVVRVVQPDAPSPPLAVPLTRALLARRFGGHAAAAGDVVVEGIAGLAAAEAGLGPTIAELDERLRSELSAGRAVSLRAAGSGAPSPEATSLVAFLLATYGRERLRRLLEEHDPERADRGALAAYERPLASLEEEWLRALRRRAGTASALRGFLGHLAPLLRPYLRRELEAFAYMLCEVAFALTLPLVAKHVIDVVIPSRDAGGLLLFVLVLVAVYALDAVVGMRRVYVSELVNQSVLTDLQRRMFERLQALSHDFHNRARVGDLTARLFDDVHVIDSATTQVAGVGVFLALRTVAAAVVVLILSPLLGAAVLIAAPLFALAYLALRARVQQASVEHQRLTGDAVATAQESLSGHAVVKAYSLEERVARAFAARLRALLRVSLRLTTIAALFETSVGLAVTTGQMIVLGLGGYLVIRGTLTIGTLVAFLGLLPSLFQPIALLSNIGQLVQRATGAFDRVSEILDAPAAVADSEDAAPLAPLAREIRLEDVTFGYEPDRPVLLGVDAAVRAGSHVAIVGRSGSGKSTLVSLLLRFWDPQGGRVLFDEHDLRDVTIASLRGQIGLVFQDTFVFDTTFRENVAFGRPDASDAEIVAAVRAAALDPLVGALPHGLDTVLGERGTRLSGGERQRLAIARALLRDPAILVLDEATSALDAETEREILGTIATASRGRTTITVTHRLRVAALADHILVVEGGRVVEEGTHDELVRSRGVYRRLHDEQTRHPTVERDDEAVAVERLRRVPLFAHLPRQELAAVAHSLTVERHETGFDVVRQGEPGERLYVVAHGRVEVLVSGSDGQRVVNSLSDGEYFGELALLSGGPRTATVRTAEPTELYSLGRPEFLALAARDTTVRDAVARRVRERREAYAAVTTQA